MVSFHLVGTTYLKGFALDLGSLDFPTPLYIALVALWIPFGTLAAILLACAFVHAAGLSTRADQLRVEWERLSDRRFLLWAMAAAFIIPSVIRLGLLHGAPLADDESAYRFAAELLASGRLWVSSPLMKEFVDQNFMINDGRLYPVYFIGWPLLMAPGVWLGAPGMVNAVYSALTVPALIGVLTHLAGRSWARAGVVVFLAAPFIQIMAATQLSHTTCLMALTWCLWMLFKIFDEPSSPRLHAAFAVAFAIAFFVRPQSALPIGFPLLVAWAATVWHLEAAPRRKAVATFAAISGASAVLFLGVLWAQNGRPWTVGYSRYLHFITEERIRFTTFRFADHNTIPGFAFSELGASIARAAGGCFRLNADLFGWPSSFAFLLFARSARSSGTSVLWSMVVSSLVVQLFQSDWGIDTFGPMHAFELALPVTCLTIVGARYLSERQIAPHRVVVAVLASLIVTAWAGFVPIRLQAVRQIASHLNVALQAPQHAGLQRAIVFAPTPFARSCSGGPNHFVFFRPTNDPDLMNDILWVNDLGAAENRRFVATMGGGRSGYLMRWTPDCKVTLEPLGESSAR